MNPKWRQRTVKWTLALCLPVLILAQQNCGPAPSGQFSVVPDEDAQLSVQTDESLGLDDVSLKKVALLSPESGELSAASRQAEGAFDMIVVEAHRLDMGFGAKLNPAKTSDVYAYLDFQSQNEGAIYRLVELEIENREDALRGFVLPVEQIDDQTVEMLRFLRKQTWPRTYRLIIDLTKGDTNRLTEILNLTNERGEFLVRKGDHFLLNDSALNADDQEALFQLKIEHGIEWIAHRQVGAECLTLDSEKLQARARRAGASGSACVY